MFAPNVHLLATIHFRLKSDETIDLKGSRDNSLGK